MPKISFVPHNEKQANKGNFWEEVVVDYGEAFN
ncbi:hypothetical protein BSPWISOXPB_7773 [uncultured Gammaproteobacteria bacterium]|nr:hypothetical protein BSPWISOXPB_4101 [uncultured Gammaproteobacteria bacterium]VVM25737.1 hypothetical protein BSPWISOXPB_7773 [uncultured Gammaproteobacteria bacterium]